MDQGDRKRGRFWTNWRMYLAVSIALILLLAFLRDEDPPEIPQANDEPLRQTISPPSAEAEPSIHREPVQARVGPIDIVDLLTGNQLDIEIECLQDARLVHRMHPREIVDLSFLETASSLRYVLPGGTDFEANPAGSTTFLDGRWTVRLPYFARIIVSIPQDLLQAVSPRSTVVVLNHPGEQLDGAPSEGVVPVLLQAPTSDTTFASKMNRFVLGSEEAIFLKAACGIQSIPSLLTAASGEYVVGVYLDDGTAGYTPVRLSPGEEVKVFVDFNRRTSIQGILLDWNGNPVPREGVTFSTALNLRDYDLSPADAVGVAGLKIDGVMYQCTKRTILSGEDGTFSMVMPRGSDYAVESSALGSRAFWSTRDAGVVLTERYEIELRLQDPDSDERVEFQVLRSDGSPLHGAEVTISVADDVPFIRQWKRKHLDESGRCFFLGVESGEKIAFLTYHPALLARLYCPKPFAVPENHQVIIVVPDDQFR